MLIDPDTIPQGEWDNLPTFKKEEILHRWRMKKLNDAGLLPTGSYAKSTQGAWWVQTKAF